MRALRPLHGHFNFLGSRIPNVVGLLVGLTFFSSITSVMAPKLLLALTLTPTFVLQGQAWRLVTWIFLTMEPLGLVFACLLLVWVGRDLFYRWGAGRFLSVCLAITVASGALFCLVAFGLGGVLTSPRFSGGSTWALVDALIIAWATQFPHQDIFVYFILPLRGRNLIYFTVGLTIVFSLFGGFLAYIPHFFAEGLMLLYLRRPALPRLFGRRRWRPSRLYSVRGEERKERWLN